MGWLAGLAFAIHAGESRSLPPQPPETTPGLPPNLTPIDRFRELLDRTPEAREEELAGRSPTQREYLRERLREFDRMSPAERELRLELLTLRHYLLPLLRTEATNRVAGLQAVPLGYRDLVRARLAAWEKLDAEQQRQMLDSESIFAGLAYVNTPEGLKADEGALAQLAGERRRRLESDLARWRSLTREQREATTALFNEFLTLTERERQRTLAVLNEASRERVARLVERLEQLNPEQRAKSIAALGRFNALPPAERDRFLKNAARWRAMSAEERSVWRRLVAKGPPVPVGFSGSAETTDSEDLPPAPPFPRGGQTVKPRE